MATAATYENWNVPLSNSTAEGWVHYFLASEGLEGGSAKQRRRRASDSQTEIPESASAVEAKDTSSKFTQIKAYDDFLEGFIELHSADVQLPTRAPKHYTLGSVSEDYQFTVPEAEQGSGVTFNISTVCSQSLLELADGSLKGAFGDSRMSFTDLQQRGMIVVATETDGGAQMTIKGLAPSSYKFTCDDGIAADLVGPVSSTDPFFAGLQKRTQGMTMDLDGVFSEVPTGLDVYPATGTRVLIGDGYGKFLDCTTDFKTVQGQYGVLHAYKHSVLYWPKLDPANIGKVEEFTYKLVHPTAGEATAKIIARVGSPQADLEWDDNNPSAEARSVEAADDRTTVSIGGMMEEAQSHQDVASPVVVLGSVTENDRLASKFTVLAVSQDGEKYEVPGEEGTDLTGSHGVLTIKADGAFIYKPSGDPESIGQIDAFNYRLHHPNGKTAAATLTVDILVSVENPIEQVEENATIDPLAYLSANSSEELQMDSHVL